MKGKPDRQHAGESDCPDVCRLADREAFGEVVQPQSGGDREREGAGAGRRVSMAQVAEHAPVEVDEAEQPDADPDREDRRHGGKGPAIGLLDRGLDGSCGVAQDVPEQKDQDPRREGVEEALDRLGQAVHARDRKAEEDGGSGDRAE